jgi:dTDP-4-dehydrorhamnose 3,5-epimerase
MPFIETGFRDLKVFEPKVFADSRGYFFESYNENVFKAEGINTNWLQDNESLSGYGVLRGLHYQLNPFAQAKLVRVVLGEVLDVVVDIRKGSPTFAKHYKIRLSADNKKQLYIPRGFAHGFAVLSDTAIFQYKCDNFYSKESEGGIIFNDGELQIDWEFDVTKAVVSEKDIALPALADCKNNFEY